MRRGIKTVEKNSEKLCKPTVNNDLYLKGRAYAERR